MGPAPLADCLVWRTNSSISLAHCQIKRRQTRHLLWMLTAHLYAPSSAGRKFVFALHRSNASSLVIQKQFLRRLRWKLLYPVPIVNFGEFATSTSLSHRPTPPPPKKKKKYINKKTINWMGVGMDQEFVPRVVSRIGGRKLRELKGRRLSGEAAVLPLGLRGQAIS